MYIIYYIYCMYIIYYIYYTYIVYIYIYVTTDIRNGCVPGDCKFYILRCKSLT